MQAWLFCGSCGNNVGYNGQAAYGVEYGIATPSMDGNAARFWLQAADPYANAYVHLHNTPAPDATHFTYEFYVLIPSGMENAPQAFEFELQQAINGDIYNYAWQANFAGGTWRVFNYGANRWEDTGIKVSRFAPDVWHHIVAVYQRTDDGRTLHVSLTFDGVENDVNIYHNKAVTGLTWLNHFNNAIQLDSNGYKPPTPYNVFIDKMKVTYW